MPRNAWTNRRRKSGQAAALGWPCALAVAVGCLAADPASAQNRRSGPVQLDGPALLSPAPQLNAAPQSGDETQTPDPGQQPALRRTWDFTPRIDLQQAYTDNATQERAGRRRDDTYTVISPGATLIHQGPRLQLSLDYSVSRFQYYSVEEESSFRHALQQTGTAELVNDAIFFDLRSSISRVELNSGGDVSASEVNDSSNQTTAMTVSASPYWVARFGGWAQSQLRYSLQQTMFSGGGLQDTTTHRITERLTAGDNFTRLLWGLTLDASETDRKGNGSSNARIGRNGDSSTQLAELNLEYVINQYLSGLGAIGYERIDDNSFDNQPNGLIWNAGAALRPGPRSSFRLVYGERYERDYFSGEAQYLFGPRSRAIVSYAQTVNTSTSLGGENLTFLGLDEFGNLIDRRTARRLQLSDSTFSFSNNAFRSDRLELRMLTEIARTSVNLIAFNEEREIDVTNSSQTSYGASLNLSRPLSAITTLGATLRYVNTEFDEQTVREDDTYSASLSLSHKLSETLSTSLSYTYLNRDSSEARNDIRENLVVLGLRKTF